MDPATLDLALQERLEAQGREGRKKIDKVFEDFVEKQVSKDSAKSAHAMRCMAVDIL